MPSANSIIYSSEHPLYETSLTQREAVGTKWVLGGRVFVYASMYDTTAIGAHKLAQQCPPVANHVTETGTLTGTTTVGSKRVTITLGATAAYAGEYNNGYLKIESATTGVGEMMKLKGHAAVASAGVLTSDLYDPWVVATSGTTTWSLVHEKWASVVIQPTTITAPAAGVTLCAWAAATSTAPNFGWLQTAGIASCLMDTTAVVAGSGLIVGAVAGTLGVAVETDIKQRIAVAVEAMTTDNVYVTADLMIAF